MNEYNIGDKVWWATCGTREVTLPCSICFGKLKITLILGNDERIETPCDYCIIGFEKPKGYTNEYQRFSDVKEITITGKEVIENEKGRQVGYRYQSYILYKNKNIFDTKEEAEIAVKKLIIEYENSERERQSYKKKKNQTHYSWSVGYHMKRLREANREIEYHSRKINELKNNKI